MLLKLLSAPLRGPLKFVEWVGGTIDGAVEAQINDAEVMKQELTRLERRLDRGELSEDEFEALERSIVRRLQAAARRMAAIGPGSSQPRSADGEIG